MSDYFSIIVRKEATNVIINPSFEVNITDGWTAIDSGAGAVFARGIAVTYYGIGSAKLTAGNAVSYFLSDGFTLADGATVYAHCMCRESTVGKGKLLIFDSTNAANRATDTGTVTGVFEKLASNWTNDTGGPVTVKLLLQNIATDGATLTYYDAVQAEIGTAETTYLDGDQPGCVWNGEAHNSTSTRSALSYDGGISYDFTADLKYYVGRTMGLSAPPVKNTFQPYAMKPGSFYNGSKVTDRPFTFFGDVTGTSFANLQDNYKLMQDIFAVGTGEMVRIEYSGGTSIKWFKARYEGGLEGDYGFSLTQAPANIRMLAPDPNMYQVNDTNDVLDVNDTATLYYMARRSRSTGQWGNMGITAIPTTGGLVNTVLHALDGKVYIGGNFTGFNGQAGWDYGVIYDPYLGTFSRWGGASDINGIIYDIIEGADGTKYLCGTFTNVGDANGDYIVSWTAAGAWASLGTPSSGATITAISKMAFDSSGNLHVVGQFTELAGVAAADGYAYWNGTAWATHGAPAVTGAEFLNAVAIDADNNIYVGGDCDNIGGVTYNNIAMWNGSAWVDVGVGLSAEVTDIELGNDEKTVYVCGEFENAGGNSNADYITIWNGTQYTNLGVPPNSTVYKIQIAPNGDIWVTGAFTTIGGYTAVDRVAFWNGATWTIPDINLPGSPTVFVIEFCNVDPVHTDNFDTYLGFSTTGAGYFAGATTVNNPGNADAWPTFALSRSGGTSATLYQIRNETTGKVLYFRHGFTNGDTLTIKLTPQGSSVTSLFLGRRPHAILPNSDNGTFVLIPGDNLITAFVDTVGSPTIVGNCLHKAVFTGSDD